jgi:aconitate hydratase
VPVRDVEGTEIVQVCVGSSVNSAYVDLAIVGAVLDGGVVHREHRPHGDAGQPPDPRDDRAERVFGQLTRAGARMLEPICGPCIGVGQAPSARRAAPADLQPQLPRPQRHGGRPDPPVLPGTAAASALTGRITDPRSLGTPPVLLPPPDELPIDDRAILDPAPPEEAASIEVVRGPGIVRRRARSTRRRARRRGAHRRPDNISTGDMAPDGALGMSVWSDISRCATFMFRRLDRGFLTGARGGRRLRRRGPQLRQGSSREHAALSAVHLGVRAVLAKSFARIHRRNLLLNGILALTFADESDYDRVEPGARLEIGGVRGRDSSAATSWSPDRTAIRRSASSSTCCRASARSCSPAGSSAPSRSSPRTPKEAHHEHSRGRARSSSTRTCSAT